MLELKQIEHRLIDVLPLNQRVHLRLVGFRAGTVPALKLDGTKVQGTREISRVLEQRWPEPPLFPAEQPLRSRVEEAERWGEEALQPIPRRLARFGSARKLTVRRAGTEASGMPFARVAALTATPVVAYYARTLEPDGRRATTAGVRADLVALPDLLRNADRLLEERVLALDPPNAATLQILATLRALDAFEDLHPLIGARSSVQHARMMFADYPARFPSFLPEAWLEPLAQLS